MLLFLNWQESWGFIPHHSCHLHNLLYRLHSTTLLVEHESEHDTADIEQFLATEYGVVADGCSWHVTKLHNKQETSKKNDCFKAQLVTSTSNSGSDQSKPKETTIFIKRSNGMLSNVSPDHLRYEFEGMRAFSKYSKGLIATPLIYNHDRKILVTEFLPDFVPLTHFFSFSTSVDVDVDVYQAMGTAMGRSHARSHRDILEPEQYSALKERFRNLEHFTFWEQQLFLPTQQTLMNVATAISPAEINDATIDVDVRLLLQRYNSYGDGTTSTTNTGPLSDAVELLRKTYMNKKEALVHADLHCNNVLVSLPGTGSSRRDRDRVDFKVIDFGACAMGPAGLDLGMFLASFMWYYAGHSEASWRRNLAGGVLAVVDAYKQAFRVQLTGGALGNVAHTKEQSMNVDGLLDEILVDAMGFMGLYTLFMSLHGFKRDDDGVIKENSSVFEVLTLQDMPELSFGDTNGRLQAAHRRQVSMSIHALFTYLDFVGNQQKVPGCGISLQSFAAIFAADDKILQRGKDHVTEFWY